MFNKMILMGRLVADPELKTTPQGVNVCTFRIAVDRRFQKQGEEKKPAKKAAAKKAEKERKKNEKKMKS